MCHHGYEPDGNCGLSSDGNSDPCLGLCTTQVCFHWFSQFQEGQAIL